MFKVFGEFDSVEELNKAAEGLFDEGDTKNISLLAKENGIDEEYAMMYSSGEIPILADVTMAAMGKIDVELPEMEKEYGGTAVCVAEYVKSLCDREEFARHVRKKGKNLKSILDQMYTLAEQQAKKKGTGKQSACIPPSTGFAMIRDYYTGGRDEKKKD